MYVAMKTLIISFLLLFSAVNAYSDFISPFQVGNKFYYKNTSGGFSQREMVSDTTIIGKTFLIVKSTNPNGWVNTTYERLDSSSLKWFQYYSFPCPGEWVIIGFNYSVNTTWYQCMPSLVSDSLSFSGDTTNILGDPVTLRMVKKIPTWRNVQNRFMWTYSEKFGIVSYASSSGYREWLVGAIIDGVTYGTTGLNPISNIIPDKYALHQNYPNPFNPSTKIKFDIPDNGAVKLKVYDVIGNEVAILVNTNLLAGTYEYSFDGSILSSGVYFYSLETGDFKETKRMLLIK